MPSSTTTTEEEPASADEAPAVAPELVVLGQRLAAMEGAKESRNAEALKKPLGDANVAARCRHAATGRTPGSKGPPSCCRSDGRAG